MKHLYLIGSLAVLCLLSACDKLSHFFDDGSNNNLNVTDKTFVIKTAIGNTAEVQAGQLAATKAINPVVKSFGQLMVSEHTQAQNDLKVVGAKVGIQVADTVDAQHRALITMLNSLSGRAFDSAYIKSQVMDHQQTYAIFQLELQAGKNPDVKSYAQKYLPHIEAHLQAAQSIAQNYR